MACIEQQCRYKNGMEDSKALISWERVLGARLELCSCSSPCLNTKPGRSIALITEVHMAIRRDNVAFQRVISPGTQQSRCPQACSCPSYNHTANGCSLVNQDAKIFATQSDYHNAISVRRTKAKAVGLNTMVTCAALACVKNHSNVAHVIRSHEESH